MFNVHWFDLAQTPFQRTHTYKYFHACINTYIYGRERGRRLECWSKTIYNYFFSIFAPVPFTKDDFRLLWMKCVCFSLLYLAGPQQEVHISDSCWSLHCHRRSFRLVWFIKRFSGYVTRDGPGFCERGVPMHAKCTYYSFIINIRTIKIIISC